MTPERSRGQSTVEFALVLPLLLLVMLGLGQLVVALQVKLAVVHGAREAARALAVDPEADVAAIVASTTALAPDAVTIEIDRQAIVGTSTSLIVVTVRAEVPNFEGWLVRSLSVSSTAAVVEEI